jgi:hypothetical protein
VNVGNATTTTLLFDQVTVTLVTAKRVFSFLSLSHSLSHFFAQFFHGKQKYVLTNLDHRRFYVVMLSETLEPFKIASP